MYSRLIGLIFFTLSFLNIAPTQANNSACSIPFKDQTNKTTGNITYNILFVKYPDSPKYPKNYIKEQTQGLALNTVKDYFKGASQGKVKIKFVVHNKFISLPENSYVYEMWNMQGNPKWRELEQRFHRDVIASADPSVDFSKSNGTLIVSDPNLTGGPRIAFRDPVSADGRNLYSVFYDGADPNQMIHEILHTFGLQDLYNRESGFNGPDQKVNQFSIMSQYFGGTNALGFEKYQLNWITDKEVICHTGGTLKVKLSSLDSKGGKKLVLIPVGTNELVGVEYRKAEKVDKYLGTSGVLIYNIKSDRWPNFIEVQNGVNVVKKGTKNYYGIEFKVNKDEVTITK